MKLLVIWNTKTVKYRNLQDIKIPVGKLRRANLCKHSALDIRVENYKFGTSLQFV